MTLERAAEILNPQHREHYDSLETVEEACYLGMLALKKQILLEGQNVIVLPCKVGDIVYLLDNIRWTRAENGVLKCKVNEFLITQYGSYAVLDCVEQFFTKQRYKTMSLYDFGINVFLDRAAAEHAAEHAAGLGDKIWTKI